MMLLHTTRSLRPAALSLAAFVAWAASGTAQAQVTNGGFNTNLNGWTTFGDASVQAGAPEGTGQLWLTTDAVADANSRNLSGTDPLATGITGGLEESVGLTIGALDPTDNFAAEGSGVSQSFAANAGDTLSFSWNFLTADDGSSTDFADYAFVVLDGQLIQLASVANATLGSGAAGYLSETGLQTFSFSFAAGGTHQISFGVADVGDYTVTSALAVDAVQLTASAVPEPAPTALLAAGLALLGWRTRQRRTR